MTRMKIAICLCHAMLTHICHIVYEHLKNLCSESNKTSKCLVLCIVQLDDNEKKTRDVLKIIVSLSQIIE